MSVYWSNLRSFFGWWATETERPNPFHRADVPSTQLDPPDVIQLDDIRKLSACCNGRDFYARRDNALIRV